MNSSPLRAVWRLALSIIITHGAAVASQLAVEQSRARTVVDLDGDWQFSKGDFATAMMPGFNETGWRTVTVPHDWSSEGPFGAEFASGTGYAPGGLGWYRKHFLLDATDTNRFVAVEFDGVYDYAEVWLNGHFVGGRPYGYSSFQCVLTPWVRFGGVNILAVRVDHSRYADSRWYTGSGIYRHVRLRLSGKLRLAHWGTCITTPEISQDAATLHLETTVKNDTGQEQAFTLRTQVLAPDGEEVGQVSATGRLASGTNGTVVQELQVAHPEMWSPDSPRLYMLKSFLSAKNATADETLTPFGIRSLQFDPQRGFFLNGVSTKFKGVCLHHDAGCLGAAVPEGVLARRLRILKELGVNAIRTSHNPPAPELLDLCDRLGFLVMDEAFDEFTPGKNKWVAGRNDGNPSHFGYAELFAQWAVRDISDMVRRDRNHPSVIMWSIGNEVDYRNDPFSDPVLGTEYRPGNPPARELVTCARPLMAAVKALDGTRPVTAALATVAMSDAVGLAQMLDAVGYNYQEWRYGEDHLKFPKRFIYGSENSIGWAQWLAARDKNYVGGQFLWTGIDYLGEAGRWPNRGSAAGLLDLCGFKKPTAWFQQSLWSRKPMVYLCASARGDRAQGRFGGFRSRFGQESWNWPSNALVTVHCFTTCPEISLLLNDRPLETRRLSEAVQGVLTWRVPFEPGVLRAVGLRDGKSECEFALRTAGPAQRIKLLPDTRQLRADGQDICHVEFRITDAQGVRVPDAGPDVKFAVEGPAKLIGIENGDLNSSVTGKDGVRSAYQGRGLGILQATREPGEVRLTAMADGLESASVRIVVRPSSAW